MKLRDILGTLACIFLLYPLSLGPAQWLVTHGIVAVDGPVGRAFHHIYRPLLYISAVPPLYDALCWYVEIVSGESLD
jgi:hypothetical protein